MSLVSRSTSVLVTSPVSGSVSVSMTLQLVSSVMSEPLTAALESNCHVKVVWLLEVTLTRFVNLYLSSPFTFSIFQVLTRLGSFIFIVSTPLRIRSSSPEMVNSIFPASMPFLRLKEKVVLSMGFSFSCSSSVSWVLVASRVTFRRRLPEASLTVVVSPDFTLLPPSGAFSSSEISQLNPTE